MEHDGAGPRGRLATLLRAHRHAAGLTQRQLAARAGISTGALEDLEQGRTRRPRPESLNRLAAALELTEEQRGELTAAPDGAVRAPARRGRAGGPAARASGRRHREPDGQRYPGEGLRLSVLGPLAAWRGGAAVDLGPARQRAVLGLLALHAGAVLPRAALIDALWPENPPPTAVVMVQAQVSRIRRLLAPAPGAAAQLSWDETGYRLGPGAMWLDLTEFTRLAAQARQAVTAGDLPGACARYERALGLWRGQPLEDIEVLYGHPAVTGLARQRDALVIDYASAAASAGRPRAALAHCEQALVIHGELKNWWAEAATLDTLGYAHHHLGQHAEAIGCYQRAIEILGDTHDLHLRADVLARLGDAQQAAGDGAAARRAWQQALALLDSLHHPDAGAVRARLSQGGAGAGQAAGTAAPGVREPGGIRPGPAAPAAPGR